MSEQISLNDKCIKCGVTLRRQAFMAMAIDAGAQTLDPCLCPNGGDHDFVDAEIAEAAIAKEKEGVK